MIQSPKSLLDSLFKGVEEPGNVGATESDGSSQPSINLHLQLEQTLQDQPTLKLQKTFKSESISQQNATILLHKRPYQKY